MKLNKIIATVVLASTSISGLALAVGPASAASAVVLVNYDGGTIHVGQYMQVGVWYQQFSGGTRHYWVGVYNPSGRLVFTRTGSASNNHWTFWYIKATQTGHYHTLYTTGGHSLRIVTSVR